MSHALSYPLSNFYTRPRLGEDASGRTQYGKKTFHFDEELHVMTQEEVRMMSDGVDKETILDVLYRQPLAEMTDMTRALEEIAQRQDQGRPSERGVRGWIMDKLRRL